MLTRPTIRASGPFRLLGLLRIWLREWRIIPVSGRCRAFMPVPGPLQTVQRAEFWGAILALEAFWPGHLGIDNLDVVRAIGRLHDRGCLSEPLPLVKDGILLLLFSLDTIRVTKVKGHASEVVMDARCALLKARESHCSSAAPVHGCRLPGVCQS